MVTHKQPKKRTNVWVRVAGHVLDLLLQPPGNMCMCEEPAGQCGSFPVSGRVDEVSNVTDVKLEEHKHLRMKKRSRTRGRRRRMFPHVPVRVNELDRENL